MTATAVAATPPLPDDLDAIVDQALAEDIASGDVTAELIPAQTAGVARVIARERAVLCGSAWFSACFQRFDPDLVVTFFCTDGDWLEPDQTVCLIEGPARGIVTVERTALNFLQTLSGTATTTRLCAERLAPSGPRLLDTRKTIPGLRQAQKFAVLCGGGTNHRIGLFDGVLIKENHIEAAGSVSAAVAAMRAAHPELPLEVEVETLAQVDEALAGGADILLLDNFDLERMNDAVTRVAGRAKLEASGGYGPDDLEALGRTGVDFISVGALTKHLRAVDFSMRMLDPDAADARTLCQRAAKIRLAQSGS